MHDETKPSAAAVPWKSPVESDPLSDVYVRDGNGIVFLRCIPKQWTPHVVRLLNATAAPSSAGCSGCAALQAEIERLTIERDDARCRVRDLEVEMDIDPIRTVSDNDLFDVANRCMRKAEDAERQLAQVANAIRAEAQQLFYDRHDAIYDALLAFADRVEAGQVPPR